MLASAPETGRRGARRARRAPLLPVSTPFSGDTRSYSPACLHGGRIPHTLISDPPYNLPSRKKHFPIYRFDLRPYPKECSVLSMNGEPCRSRPTTTPGCFRPKNSRRLWRKTTGWTLRIRSVCNLLKRLERETGIEPATTRLGK